MKRIFLFGLMACTIGFNIKALAQKAVHHGYVTYYNVGKGEPDSVSWLLTPTMVSCDSTPRRDQFAADP